MAGQVVIGPGTCSAQGGQGQTLPHVGDAEEAQQRALSDIWRFIRETLLKMVASYW